MTFATVRPHTQEKSSILLIDDSLEAQRQLIHALRPHYRLTTANDGWAGYQRALACHPDLILLDVCMPKMDGLDACHLLKTDPTTKDIPVIFLSSLNTAEQRIQGLSQGGVDYVCKPFLAEEILARIRIHLHLASRIKSTPSPASPVIRNPDEVAFEAAKQLINQHLDAPLPLATLARKVGMHGKKLSQIFRERTGLTLFAFSREERIRQAARLLAETDLSVQDIADEIGLPNAANFATVFRQRMGVTPRDYRQAMRTESKPSC